MDIFDAYEMDSDAVSKGVWGDLIVQGKTIGRLRCRPNDPDLNPEYRKALNVAGVAYAALKEGGTDSDKLAKARDDMTCGVYADTIVTDFELYRTVKSGKTKGKEVRIPYSKEKCKELLAKLPKLLAAAEGIATGWTKFRKGQVDETVKI